MRFPLSSYKRMILMVISPHKHIRTSRDPQAHPSAEISAHTESSDGRDRMLPCITRIGYHQREIRSILRAAPHPYRPCVRTSYGWHDRRSSCDPMNLFLMIYIELLLP